MSEKQEEQEQNNDSTQQLYNDWLQLCLSVGTMTTTTTTTTKNVKKDAKIAFQLFTDSMYCNIDEKLALLIKELNPAFVSSTTGSVVASDLINYPYIIQQQQQKENDNNNNPTSTSNTTTIIQNVSSTMQSRLSALQCLSGALEGIVLSMNTNQTTTKSNTTVSLNFTNLFGTFLLQHCGPILIDDGNNNNNHNDNNYDIDIEDKIRDEAICGLNLLVQLLPLSTTKSLSSESESESQSDVNEKIIKTILLFGQSGLEKRCSIKEEEVDDDDYDDDNYHDTNEDYMEIDSNNLKQNNDNTTSTNYRVGLSLLSRSRRSLLFTLLHSCIQAISNTCCSSSSSSSSSANYSKTISASVMTEIVQFVIVCIDCLHGESDPRCLIQLLTLFHTMLIVLRPIFLLSKTTATTSSSTTDSSTTNFPIYVMFNAISLYYPIQFNPPPNNIHNITKKTLREAILLIMSCTLYETTTSISIPTTDDDTENSNTIKGSMIRLSINIIAEALVSPENDDNNTVKELMDVLDDLSICLFGTDTTTTTNKANIQYLTSIDMKKISDALITVHDMYTQRVSDSNSNNVEFNLNKELVTKCRIIISHIAYETEQLLVKCPILWQSFVQKPLRTIISLNDVSISSTSSIISSRIAIAYIANICSCGGIETLRYGLQIGLQPLVQTLKQQTKNYTLSNTNVLSIDDYCIALNAVGAYFSSARVTLSSSTNKHYFTIKLPHPLQPYTSDALETIVTILLLSSTTEQNVKICALKAFECIVTVAPVDQFTTKNIKQTKQLIQSISTNILAESSSSKTKNNNNDHTQNNESFDSDKKQWLLACARCIGSFLSMTANVNDNREQAVFQTIFYSPEIKEFLRNDVLLVLLKSVEQSNTNGNLRVRYDREVVSTTCEQSVDVAKIVVTSLMTSLLNYIEQRDYMHALATAESLNYILQQKDSFSCIAFQETTPSIFDLLDALVPNTNDTPVVDDDVMYKLQLPPSSDDQIRVQETLTRASMIVQYLRVVYFTNTINNNKITSQHLQRLVKYVESSLPPLSEYDFNRTYIVLPLLSSALRNSHTSGKNDTTEQESIQTRQLLQSMTIDLADIAINSSNLIAREHAAHCIYAAIAYFSINSSDCNAAKVAKDTVVSSLQYDIASCTVKDTGSAVRDVDKVIRKVTDSFSMLSLLGAAAAIRGGTSNPTVDEILRFFLNLSNNKSASYPFISSSEQAILDLAILDAGASTLNSTFLSARAASAFGMLLTCSGHAPIRKQRLCHIAMKQIKDMKLQSENPLLPLGTRIAIAHIACCIDIRSINTQDLIIIIDILLSSLSTDALEESTTLAVKSLKLALTSVIKLLHLSPTTLYSKLYIVVTGVMRAFAYTNEIDCKLLSLQILGTVAKLEDVSDVLNKLKAPVTSILAVSMNQSSVLLRQAAVKVRNDWFLVE